ncbi:MAG: transporter related [Mycobacterium sp.]|nr:transporter related [Mycobacterium sp.]
MIAVHDLELRAGARVLVEGATLRIAAGDRIGLVGRNGAGKTTMLKILAGEGQPHAGSIEVRGTVGYLPQDPRTGDLSQTARERVLAARGLDAIVRDMEKTQVEMAGLVDEAALDAAVRTYGRLEDAFHRLGGYAAESEAATICANLNLPDRILAQSLDTLSGGQRRRVELARILFSDAETLLLDEPTNHLDADSIGWLRDYLRQHKGGLVVISHDVELLAATVTRVVHLDATRAAMDVYNMNWKNYLTQRETDERRRKRERTNAEKKATALKAQADSMRAKATKAKAAHSMDKRAERMLAGLEQTRTADRVAKLRFPEPSPCGRTPLTAEGLSKCYGSLEIFTDVDLAIDRGSRVVVLGLNGAGKTTLLRMLAGVMEPDTGEVVPGHGLKLGYYAQEHETLDADRSVLENARSASPDLNDTEVRKVLGSFLFSGDDVEKPAGVLSGGEKTRLALACLVTSSANVLLLDEPTNNLDPASREEILSALAGYKGAVVLVTHDDGAVLALNPDKVLMLPDGVEDNWSPDLTDLVALA